MSEYRIVRDRSKELETMYRKVVGKDNQHFPELQLLRFLFTYRQGKPEWTKDNLIVYAQVRKLPPRERDVYLFDVELRVWKEGWDEMSPKQKRRTIWHELRHIQVDLDEDFKPHLDSENRIKFYLAPHDIVIKTFKDEIEKFGLNPIDKQPIELLSKHMGDKITIRKKAKRKVRQA